MNVLFITSRADFSGGPEHLWQLLRHFSTKVSATVACPTQMPYHQRYTLEVGPSNIVAIPHRAVSVRALGQLAIEVRRRGIELIHSHGKGAGLFGRSLALITGRPCVHTFHGLHIGQYDSVMRKLYFVYEKLAGMVTSATVCVSHGERAQFLRAGVLPESKLHVICNGVSTPLLRSTEPPDTTLQIVAVNRYDYQKNPDLMLAVADGLRARLGASAFRLTVLGTGERLEACREIVESQGLTSCVSLVGSTAEPRLRFRQAHVFLSTSRWEGMPLAMLEAMSEGLPAVGTNVVGNCDVIEDGINGYLFPLESVESCIEALIKLRSPILRGRFGAAARHRVELRHSVTEMAAAHERLYCTVLSKRSRRRRLR